MTEPPEPITEPPKEEGAQTFEELGLSKEVLAALEDMGWETPTPVQRDSYPLAVAGHDIIEIRDSRLDTRACLLESPVSSRRSRSTRQLPVQ